MVVPPIAMATTYKQSEPGEHYGFEYSRSGNPTRECFEKCLASLEGGKHGLVFASGLCASTTMMLMLKSGDHVVVMDDVYGGTNLLFSKCLVHHGLEFDFVDCRYLDRLEAAIRPTTRMLWIETPTNPTMKIVDIQAVAAVAHKHEDIIVVVDNTFMSPYFQRPLMFGADVAFSSITKYINGHSDTVMGGCVTNSDAIYERLKYLQNAAGGVPSPFDCYLANRGCKTLHVRMERHQENALAIAKYLESRTDVVKYVMYPGLESHPQHELVNRQCSGYSGMLCLELKQLNGQSVARKFLRSVQMFTLAESLGGFESLIEHPAIMTHASVDPADREKLGISDDFVRLSVGLEDKENLIEDLKQALEKAFASE